MPWAGQGLQSRGCACSPGPLGFITKTEGLHKRQGQQKVDLPGQECVPHQLCTRHSLLAPLSRLLGVRPASGNCPSSRPSIGPPLLAAPDAPRPGEPPAHPCVAPSRSGPTPCEAEKTRVQPPGSPLRSGPWSCFMLWVRRPKLMFRPHPLPTVLRPRRGLGSGPKLYCRPSVGRLAAQEWGGFDRRCCHLCLSPWLAFGGDHPGRPGSDWKGWGPSTPLPLFFLTHWDLLAGCPSPITKTRTQELKYHCCHQRVD